MAFRGTGECLPADGGGFPSEGCGDAGGESRRSKPAGIASRAWTKLTLALKLGVIALGVVAGVVLLSAGSETPWMCIIQVSGLSMTPTLQENEQCLFARVPWHIDDIVIADVGEDTPVVKRVAAVRPGNRVILAGDNLFISQCYWAAPSDIKGVMVVRLPFTSPLATRQAQAMAME